MVMRGAVATCDECEWQSRTYKHSGSAVNALRHHKRLAHEVDDHELMIKVGTSHHCLTSNCMATPMAEQHMNDAWVCEPG